jgi:hypothetical protein
VHGAVFGHGQSVIPHPHAPCALEHEVELLRADMLVQGVRAHGRQAPETCTHIFAAGTLEVIGVRDLHQVGRPPVEVFGLDEVVTRDGGHLDERERVRERLSPSGHGEGSGGAGIHVSLIPR